MSNCVYQQLLYIISMPPHYSKLKLRKMTFTKTCLTSNNAQTIPYTSSCKTSSQCHPAGYIWSEFQRIPYFHQCITQNKSLSKHWIVESWYNNNHIIYWEDYILLFQVTLVMLLMGNVPCWLEMAFTLWWHRKSTVSYFSNKSFVYIIVY